MTMDLGHAQALEAFHEALVRDDPELLYERAPCGFLSTSPDGTVLKVNETLLTWLGYSSEELVGRRSFVDLLTVGGKLYHETHYAPMLRMQGTVREIALDLVRADGGRIPVLVNANVGLSELGEPAIIRIALFDATERRGYERELLAAKERAEESESRVRDLAHALQNTLIPPSLPHIDGLEVAAKFRPAVAGIDVGGDFYDVFAIGPDEWVVVIGDVCGKGVEAAGLTALARHTIRAVAVGLHSPGAALGALNDALLASESDRFCTATLVHLQREGGSWRAVIGSAGHPAPLLVRPGGTAVPSLAAGPLLGVMEEVEFDQAEIVLEPGDHLVLYTDGVLEARRDLEFFGEERLVAAVVRHRGSAAGIVAGLVDEVLDFQHGAPRDDIAVVAVGVPLASAEG